MENVRLKWKERKMKVQDGEEILHELVPQKKKILTVHMDFCKIIILKWRKLWFVGV